MFLIVFSSLWNGLFRSSFFFRKYGFRILQAATSKAQQPTKWLNIGPDPIQAQDIAKQFPHGPHGPILVSWSIMKPCFLPCQAVTHATSLILCILAARERERGLESGVPAWFLTRGLPDEIQVEVQGLRCCWCIVNASDIRGADNFAETMNAGKSEQRKTLGLMPDTENLYSSFMISGL